MEWKTMRTVRRRARRATRVGKWPTHTKVAVGAWIPVLVVGIALYTGPFRRSAAAPVPETTTVPARVYVPLTAPDNSQTPHIQTAADQAQRAAILKWVAAIPTRRTLLQARAIDQYNMRRLKMMLAQEQAASHIVRAPRTAGR